MSSHPPVPDATADDAETAVTKSPTFTHVVADHGLCVFLGVDYDLSLLASSQAPTAIPKIMKSGAGKNVTAQSELIENVRVRMNTASAFHVASNILFALIGSGEMATEEIIAEIQRMGEFLQAQDGTVQ